MWFSRNWIATLEATTAMEGFRSIQVANQAGVVGFGVGDDQHVDRLRIDLFLEQRQPAGFKFEVACIDQGRAFTPHQKGVVGGDSSGNKEAEPWLVGAWLPCHIAAAPVTFRKVVTPWLPFRRP